MSRSTYIWVVTKDEDTRPVAAFTVKWELEKCLNDIPNEKLADMHVWRLNDNKPYMMPTKLLVGKDL